MGKVYLVYFIWAYHFISYYNNIIIFFYSYFSHHFLVSRITMKRIVQDNRILTQPVPIKLISNFWIWYFFCFDCSKCIVCWCIFLNRVYLWARFETKRSYLWIAFNNNNNSNGTRNNCVFHYYEYHWQKKNEFWFNVLNWIAFSFWWPWLEARASFRTRQLNLILVVFWQTQTKQTIPNVWMNNILNNSMAYFIQLTSINC